MSALFERLGALHAAAARRPAPLLRSDDIVGPVERFRPAAVLMAVTDRATGPGLLLLHRPSNMRAHPGQIAFPGGKVDPGETPVQAALREAWEELGIDRGVVRIVGETDLYLSGSGYEITPVLACVPANIAIRPNPTEVASWFEAPLDFVLDPENQVERWVDWDGGKRSYIEIRWGEHRIWGVTAAIIVNLSRRLAWHR